MKINVLIILVLLLGACAQPPKLIPVENPEQVWKVRSTYLYGREVWKANMSVVGATAEEKFKTRLNWDQNNNSYQIKLRDFIGRTVAIINGSDSHVSAKTSKGKTYKGETAEELLDEIAGMRIPLDGLRYWLRGLPEPGAKLDSFILGEDGVAKSMKQNGWQMSYPSYEKFGDIQMPKQVLLAYDDLNLTVNISSWDLIQ